MPESNKMQIRTSLISLLSKYQSARDVSSSTIKNDIEIIKKIEDNDYVVRILLDEINDKNKEYSNICALFLIQAASQNALENQSLKILNSKKISDSKKIFIISILKQRGVGIALDDLNSYINSSSSLLDEQINSFLDGVYNSPESQIDLLDFFVNIIPQERFCLINNLIKETSSDKLAIILSLFLHCEIDDSELEIILDALLKTNSLYSTYGLDYLLQKNAKENFLSQAALKKIQQVINKNKLKDKDFIDTSLITNSKIDKCLISLVDGKSMFSLVFSRVNKDNTRSCVLMTIDIQKGVTSTIGFSNLKLEEFMKILKRVFNGCLPVDINPIALKAIFDFYYNKNFRTNTLIPYELSVWKKYLNDIRNIDYELDEFLNSKLDITALNDGKIKKIINSKFFESWFYLQGENENIDKIINFIESQKKFNISQIESLIQETLQKNFVQNLDYIKKIHSDLLIQAYVSHLSKFKATSNAAYSICFNLKYLTIFINSIIDKSIYQYYLSEIEKTEKNGKNLFKKSEKTKLSKKNIEKLIKYFEEKWK